MDQKLGVKTPSFCNHSGIMKRGIIEPPIAESSNTAKVLTVCIWACVLQSEAMRSANPVARTEAPKQAIETASSEACIGTLKNIAATAHIIAACRNPISVRNTNFPASIPKAPNGPTINRSLMPFLRSSIEMAAPCIAENRRNRIAVAPI